MRELTEQEVVRREKAEKLRELGLDPFGHSFQRMLMHRKSKKNIKM